MPVTFDELNANILENTAALKEVAAGLKAAADARDAVIAKMGDAGGAPAATRTRRKAAETPAENAGAAEVTETVATSTDTGPIAGDAAAKPDWLASETKEAVVAIANPWLAGTDDKATRDGYISKLTSFINKAGGTQLSDLPDEIAIRKVAFWLTLAVAGHEVNLNADYDFYADPLSQVSAAPVAEEFNPLA